MKIHLLLFFLLFFFQKAIFAQEISEYQTISGGFNTSTESGYENESIVGEVFVADESGLNDTKVQLGLFYTDFTSTVSPTDSLILVQIYQQTNGKKWKNTWDLTKNIDTWFGLTVQGKKVIEINLRGNGLQGELPAVFENTDILSRLEYLNLSDNQISGKIPNDLGKLSELKYIDLSGNAFTSVSAAVFRLPKLETLWLSNNQLSIIPDSLQANLIKNLFLQNNLLENLPSSFEKLNKLKILNLANNRLKNLPDFMSAFTDLEELYLERNFLQILPNLSKTNLKILNFSYNNIKNLPADFANMNNLSKLDLSQNHFTFYEMLLLVNTKIANVIYAPQKIVNAPTEVSIKLYENYDLNSFIQDLGQNNVYIWKKNDAVTSQTGANFRFTNMNNAQIGTYFCEVKNFLFPLLTLRRQATVVKLSCEGNPIEIEASSLTICKGESIDLSLKTATKGSIRWLKEGKVLQASTQNGVKIDEYGYYSAEITIDGCTQSSNVLQIKEGKSLPIKLTFKDDVLEADFANKNVIFQWFLNNENVAFTDVPTFKPTKLGFYYVKVSATDGSCPAVSNLISVQITGTESDLTLENIVLYPNPAYDLLYLKTPQTLSEIRIYDALGRLVGSPEAKINAGVYEIRTEKLTAGAHFLQIKTAKSSMQIRFVKE